MKKKCIFLQDNAPAHKSIKPMAKINELCIELLPHPPYSDALAFSDFYLFPNLKRWLQIVEIPDWAEKRLCYRINRIFAEKVVFSLSSYELIEFPSNISLSHQFAKDYFRILFLTVFRFLYIQEHCYNTTYLTYSLVNAQSTIWFDPNLIPDIINNISNYHGSSLKEHKKYNCYNLGDRYFYYSINFINNIVLSQ